MNNDNHLLTRLLDWICDRIGLRLVFDGDLCAPDGTEPWWPAAASCGTGTRTTTTDRNQPAAGHQDFWTANPAITPIEADAEAEAQRDWYERVMRLSQVALFHLPAARDE